MQTDDRNPSRPLRIAFIGGRGVAANYSGIETYYAEIGSRLAARGHEVTAYCRKNFTPDIETYRGIKVRRLPAPASKHFETITHSVLSTLDALVRPYDIVQYHAIGSAPLALLPRAFGKATVVSVRGLDWQRGKWGRVARAVLKAGEWASARCPTKTAVVSKTLQRHYEERHGTTPVCIQNPVTPVESVAPDKILELGFEKDGYILFAGRISPEKQVDVLLKALSPLRGIRPMKIAIAGGSSYSQDYIDRVKSLAWDDVVFLGNVDRSVMAELFSNCYFYVLPSVMEGLSISLLEAVSYGNCIVTTAIPENLEVVGDAGFSFPVGDVEALRKIAERLLEDPALVDEYRRKARACADAQPDWDETAERTERFYYDLLNRRGPLATAGLDRTPT
jgi:glycosyltransferase involved in cell wall biosynthesis